MLHSMPRVNQMPETAPNCAEYQGTVETECLPTLRIRTWRHDNRWNGLEAEAV